jgi:membrane protein
MAQAATGGPAAGASSPGQIPPAGWFQILKRTYAESTKDNVNLVAAGVAFYAFLAFVPLLGALVLSYGPGGRAGFRRPARAGPDLGDAGRSGQADWRAAAEHLADRHIQEGFRPAACDPGLALRAMRGATSIITALNIVYGVEEDRGFVKTTLLAIAITVGAVVAMIVGMTAVSALGLVERLLPFSSPLIHSLLKILSWVAAAAVVSLVIALIYRYAPNRPNPKWAWLTPGSIGATLLWIAATLGFGFYVANFGSYNATYGSLGAVVVFLTWLYLTGYILLMGGELNSELEKVAGPSAQPGPR